MQCEPSKEPSLTKNSILSTQAFGSSLSKLTSLQIVTWFKRLIYRRKISITNIASVDNKLDSGQQNLQHYCLLTSTH